MGIRSEPKHYSEVTNKRTMLRAPHMRKIYNYAKYATYEKVFSLKKNNVFYYLRVWNIKFEFYAKIKCRSTRERLTLF